MKKPLQPLFLFFFTCIPLISSATTIHVPADSATIQAAINGALDGDTVLVAPGTYTGDGNKNIELLGKAIVVMSEAGPEQTIIDCEDSGRAFYIKDDEGNDTEIIGFTVRNTGSTAGGIRCDYHESPIIRNCIIENIGNRGIYLGGTSSAIIENCIIRNCNGGIYSSGNASQAIVRNCLLINNSGFYGGVFCEGSSAPLIINTTIYGNHSTNKSGGVYSSGQMHIRNSIVWANTGNISSQNLYSLQADVTYSTIEGDWPGRGNLHKDPLFVDADLEDFHLSASSPCIDAGNPFDPFQNEPAPNGTRVNMGAFGNTTEATTGYEDKPIIHTIEPETGPTTGGTLVNIWGVNFGNTAGGLSFDGLDATVLAWKDDQIIARTPAHSSGRVTLRVNNTNGKTDSLTQGFHYSGGNVLNVPQEFATIQQAIYMALDGDTVMVAPGTYTGDGNKDLELLGKAIVVMSEAGPEQTIIDCEGSGRGFYIKDGEGNDTEIIGFTVRNTGSAVGGIRCDNNESPTIKDCIVENIGNRGIYLGGTTSAVIENCIIRNCNGGVYSSGSAGFAVVRNCQIYNNSGFYSGIYSDGYSAPLLLNSIIYGNHSTSKSGGIHGDGLIKMRNSIVWGNSTSSANDPNLTANSSEISYSCIEGGWPGEGNIVDDPLFTDAGSEDFHLQAASACIDAGDPKDDFSNEPLPNGGRVNMGAFGNTPDASPGSSDAPLITGISPSSGTSSGGVIDTLYGSDFGMITGTVFFGDSSAMILEWEDDRIICSTPFYTEGEVDVKVRTSEERNAILENGFIFTSRIPIRVPQDYPTIQEAIDSAIQGDIVLVAAGTFKGPGNKDLKLRGKEITLISEAGPESTIIDCEDDGSGFYMNTSINHETVISGFTILNSSSSGIFLYYNVSPTIENCIIESSAPRGIYLYGDNSPVINNCIIRKNQRGIYTRQGVESAIFRNCLISDNNYNYNNGAGIYCEDESPQLINCTIVDNHSLGKGGGVYAPDGLNMENCIVWNNTAGSYESVFTYNSHVTFSNIQGDWPGKGNLNTDPLFVDPDAGDYHLMPGSPSIDAGNPALDFSHEPAFNGGRINQGAYGNTNLAATSDPAVPVLHNALPDKGSPQGGELISITGLNFGNVQGEIHFGGIAGTISLWSDSLVICVVPAHPSGWVDIGLTNSGDQEGVLVKSYRYLGPAVLKVPSEYPTIQAAINLAEEKDTVLVAPGVYTGPGNRALDFLGKDIVVISESGPEETIIDCENTPRGFDVLTFVDLTTFISGFTIRNSSSEGIVLSSTGASPTIENCIIEKNARQGVYLFGNNAPVIRNCVIQNNNRGIYARQNTKDTRIENCVIAQNYTSGNGAGIYCEDDSPLIVNCTVAGNSCTNQGGGIYVVGDLQLKNSIVWHNLAQVDSSANIALTGTADVSWSCIQDGWPGMGNISSRPIFEDRFDLDFHLHSASPCIDTGDPADAFDHEPPDNGGRINMGAYGNTAEATSFDPKTAIAGYAVPPTCEPEAQVSLFGLYFDTSGTLLIGNDTINQIDLWTDSLIRFMAPTDLLGEEDIILHTPLGSDTLKASNVLTPKVQYVSGDVSGVWSADCPGIYILTGNITLQESDSLIIEPGVKVYVDLDSAGLNAQFLVRGDLVAEGTQDNPILFSVLPHQAGPGRWSGIEVRPGNNLKKAVLRHCVIENARIGIECRAWASGCSKADNRSIIEYCTIRQNSGEGIRCYASGSSSGCTISKVGVCTPTIRYNRIHDNGSGLYLQAYSGFLSSGYVNARISNNLIYDNSDYGINCSGTNNVEPDVMNNDIYNNGKAGIHFGENFRQAYFIIKNNIFYNNEVGIQATQDSMPVILNNCLWENALNYKRVIPDTSNILADPLFVNIAGGDLRVYSNSPCIDTGNNSDLDSALDFAGNNRVADGNGNGEARVDVGALEYELPQPIGQPVSLELCPGETASFGFFTDADPTFHQWFKNDQPISGAESAELVLENITSNDEASYSCRLTDDLGGVVFSMPATLSLLPTASCGLQDSCQADTLAFVEEIPSGDYRAAAKITASAEIADGANVSLQAGQEITFLPGFTAPEGSNCLAEIVSCTLFDNTQEAAQLLEVKEKQNKIRPKQEGAGVSSAQKVTIFPNPSNGHFTLLLEGRQENVQVLLYDANGRLLDSRSGKTGELNYTRFPAGIYWLKVVCSEGCVSRKLVVQ